MKKSFKILGLSLMMLFSISSMASNTCSLDCYGDVYSCQEGDVCTFTEPNWLSCTKPTGQVTYYFCGLGG